MLDRKQRFILPWLLNFLVRERKDHPPLLQAPAKSNIMRHVPLSTPLSLPPHTTVLPIAHPSLKPPSLLCPSHWRQTSALCCTKPCRTSRSPRRQRHAPTSTPGDGDTRDGVDVLQVQGVGVQQGGSAGGVGLPWSYYTAPGTANCANCMARSSVPGARLRCDATTRLPRGNTAVWWVGRGSIEAVGDTSGCTCG